MNWGIKITILYLSFVALILTLVFNCMSQKVELESPDYYANELMYQEKIDATNNANAAGATIDHKVTGKNILLSMDSTMRNSDIKGEIYLYRPSNSKNDIRMPMKFNEHGEQIINSSKLITGVYEMQLTWETKGIKYYKEEIINLK